MSAVPAEVVVAKTGVEEPLVVHVVNVPTSGPQNNVLLLPKELDEKVAKMHFSALVAELIVLSVEVFSTGTSPKADCRATVLYEVVLRLVFTEFLVQVTRGTHVARRVSQLLSVRELWSLSGDPATSAYFLRRHCSFTSRPARLYVSTPECILG